MSFDDIFDHIGGFGWYQVALFAIIDLQCCFSAFVAMATIFLAPDQDHWCYVEELIQLPFDVQKQVAIPLVDGSYDRCEFYDMRYNYTDVQYCYWNDSSVADGTTDCVSWNYDYTQFAKTAVSDYELVCSRAILVSVIYSSYLLALMIAAVTSGAASDYFGRKKVLVVAMVLQIVFAFFAAVSPSYGWFFSFRFLLGYCSIAANICAFMIISETVGVSYRAVVGSIFWCIYGVAIIVLSTIAYFVTDYRYIQHILATAMVPGLAYVWLVPESPRWLVDHGMVDEAIAILQFIADVNRKLMPPNAEEIILSDVKPANGDESTVLINKEHGKWHMLFVNSTIRKTLLLLFPAWIASSLVYWGISFNIGALSGNLYVNVIISGSVEIPANIAPFILIRYLGRKKTQVFSLTMAGLFCFLCVPFVSEDGSTVVTGLSLVGKFFIVIAYTTIFLYTVDLFPTPVRNIAHGMCNFIGNLAGLLAPFMGAPLMAVWLPLPLIIFGAIGILAGPIVMLLPETTGLQLPDTLEEAEALWEKKKKSSAKVHDISTNIPAVSSTTAL